MALLKSDIFARLKTEILPLEGLRTLPAGSANLLGLGAINQSFPQGHLPIGAVHEFISEGPESAAATTGFIAALVGGLMKKNGVAAWIGPGGNLFPPALKSFGIDPERVIFIDLQKEKDILWAMEEALKCAGLAAVVGELPQCSFTTSRRFQLAVEQSRVTGFISRSNPRDLSGNASVSRWKIVPEPSETAGGLPGLGHARWHVELLKIRNGRPGCWQVEWNADHFHLIQEKMPAIVLHPKRKTG